MTDSAEILAELATLAKNARANETRNHSSDAPRLRDDRLELLDTLERLILRTAAIINANEFSTAETDADAKAII